MQTRKVFITILFLSVTTCSFIIAQSKPSESDYLLQNVEVNAKIIPFAGVAIPVDKFAHIDDGRAKTGFSGGVEFIHNSSFGPVLHVSYSANSIDQGSVTRTDISTTWKNVLILGGVNALSGKISNWGSYYAAPLVGILIGSKPLMYYYYWNWVNQITDADNTTAFAAGLTAGISYKNITLRAMFVYSAPKYETQGYSFAAIIPTGNRNITNKFELLQLSLGYTL